MYFFFLIPPDGLSFFQVSEKKIDLSISMYGNFFVWKSRFLRTETILPMIEQRHQKVQ